MACTYISCLQQQPNFRQGYDGRLLHCQVAISVFRWVDQDQPRSCRILQSQLWSRRTQYSWWSLQPHCNMTSRGSIWICSLWWNSPSPWTQYLEMVIWTPCWGPLSCHSWVRPETRRSGWRPSRVWWSRYVPDQPRHPGGRVQDREEYGPGGGPQHHGQDPWRRGDPGEVVQDTESQLWGWRQSRLWSIMQMILLNAILELT